MQRRWPGPAAADKRGAALGAPAAATAPGVPTVNCALLNCSGLFSLSGALRPDFYPLVEVLENLKCHWMIYRLSLKISSKTCLRVFHLDPTKIPLKTKMHLKL